MTVEIELITTNLFPFNHFDVGEMIYDANSKILVVKNSGSTGLRVDMNGLLLGSRQIDYTGYRDALRFRKVKSLKVVIE